LLTILRDLRLGARNLLRTPGFTVVTALTLAVGVGANISIFSIVYRVLWTPLEFAEPDRLALLWEGSPDDTGAMRRGRLTAGNFADLSQQTTAFERIAIFGSASRNWTGAGEPMQLLGARVSQDYFRVLGASPLLGRTFSPDEQVPGHDRVLVLSYGLWQSGFGGAPDVVGRSVVLDGEPFEIVGVMPNGIYPTWPQATGRLPFLPLYQQFFIPMALNDEAAADRRSHLFGVIARLDEGTTLESARGEMDIIASRLEVADPRANAGIRLMVSPYMDEVVGGVRPALLVLLGAVALVLLVACANIASLFLARAAARHREMAVRTALGARRSALIRVLLGESLLLASAGGALGMVLSWTGLGFLLRLSPRAIPRLAEASVGGAVLGFGVLVTLLAGLVLGLVPAFKLSRPDVPKALKAGGRTTRETGLGARRGLVVAEVSMAVVLVVGAGLLLQSFRHLRELDYGFRADNVLVAEFALPRARYTDWHAVADFHRALLDRLRAQPHVSSAALTYDHPLESNWIDSFQLVGTAGADEALSATLRIVSEDYFRTAGVRLLEGRDFEPLDDARHQGVAIVNEAFVRRYFAGVSPLGRGIATSTPSRVLGEPLPEFEIVGVVANVKFLGPSAPSEPAFYIPARQFPVHEMLVAVRTDNDPLAFLPSLRTEVWALDPNLPISNITTMERLLSESLSQPRFNAFLLGLFGSTALALAAMGVYALLSYTVAGRTGEIGLRLALGARRVDVVRLVVTQGLWLTVMGLGIGLTAALLAGRALSSLLFGIRARDPWTLVLVTATLVGTGLLASYLPARRATRIEPIAALRYE
jgi:putative ABC transport system permease protein